MSIICKNCSEVYSGKFCNNCGQPASVKRLSWKYTFNEIRTGFVNYDKYKLLTIKDLFIKPGDTIREFIDGKRINHYKPFSLLLVVASLSLLLHHQFNIQLFSPADSYDSDAEKNAFMYLYSWLESHFSIATLLTLPLYSVGSFIAFKNEGYNFTEHLVLNTYLAVQRLIVGIAAFPLMYIYNGMPEISYINRLLLIIYFGLLVWGYSQFFNKLSFKSSFLRTMLSYIIFILLFVSLILTISWILENIIQVGNTTNIFPENFQSLSQGCPNSLNLL